MFTLCTIPFFDSSMSQLVREIRNKVAQKAHAYVCVTGAHGVIEAQQHPQFQQSLLHAGFVVPDGMPIVWAGSWLNKVKIDRIYGPDLMGEVCVMAEKNALSVFLFGTTKQTLAKLADKIKERCPKLHIVGMFAPPFGDFSEIENKKIYAKINASRAHIVFVGLSTPKQEYWMNAALGHIRSNVLIGVGAAFDFLSGTKKQAPLWMRNLGCEWFFRLIHEPRRLWKRYITIAVYMPFLFGKLFFQKATKTLFG